MSYLYIPTYSDVKLLYNKTQKPYILAFKNRKDLNHIPLRPDIDIKYIKNKPPSNGMWKHMLSHATMKFPASKLKTVHVYNGRMHLHNKLEGGSIEQWNIEQVHLYTLCDELINKEKGVIIVDHIVDHSTMTFDVDVYNPPSNNTTVFDSMLDEYF